MSQNYKKIFLSLGPIGYSKYAPGTLGSFFTLLFIVLLKKILPGNQLFIFCILIIFILLIYWLSARFIKEIVKDKELDQPWIVIDEFIGMIIAGSPFLLLNTSLWVLISGFILFRLFDISKPWLIGRIDKKNTAPAVMQDDILSGVIVFLILFFINKLI